MYNILKFDPLFIYIQCNLKFGAIEGQSESPQT